MIPGITVGTVSSELDEDGCCCYTIRQKPKVGTLMPSASFIGKLNIALGKRLFLALPLVGERPIVPVAGSRYPCVADWLQLYLQV